MTCTAWTIQAFGAYLIVLNFGLMAAPNVLLPLFGMPRTSEGLASPMLIAFGLVGLAAGVWTILTLRGEARSASGA